MESKKPVIGKYILDSLSIGMYNHPLMLIREYIQNATDAIDEFRKRNGLLGYDPKIEIQIDGITHCLKIIDNGSGISSNQSWEILHDIGNSKKRLNENRGFRGIGRLGGLGYCDSLIFKTKFFGEELCTVSSWDCCKLGKLIKSDNHYDTQGILKEIISFEQQKYDRDIEGHFFEVEMVNLNSSRDMLLNVPLIKEYIASVAPVSFNKKQFSFGNEIEAELKKRIPNYETYKIAVNGEQIFKPYADEIRLRGDKKDRISGIDFINFNIDGRSLAFGWMARSKLLGTISSHSNFDGIRVRRDNILVGDNQLLSEFFREKRFNNYLVGEIYTVDEHLIPNSRRDDFEDNKEKDDFYESFIKNIGLPISKRIRQISIERGKARINSQEIKIIEQAKNILKEGYLADYQKRVILRELMCFKIKNDPIDENIDELISGIQNSKHHLDTNGNSSNKKNRALLKSIFEILYKDYDDKEKAIRIIKKILDIRI